MFSFSISPRFSETDALGHVNNTVLPVWFEQAREPVFRFFTPDLDHKKWRLIIAKIEVDFLGEIFYGEDIEIKTFLLKVGSSSMTIGQEAWQGGVKKARGKSVMIHFDYKNKQSVPIPDAIREQLEVHLASSDQIF